MANRSIGYIAAHGEASCAALPRATCSAVSVWVFFELTATHGPASGLFTDPATDPPADPPPTAIASKGSPGSHPGCGPRAHNLRLQGHHRTREYHYKPLRYLILIRVTHGRDRFSQFVPSAASRAVRALLAARASGDRRHGGGLARPADGNAGLREDRRHQARTA